MSEQTENAIQEESVVVESTDKQVIDQYLSDPSVQEKLDQHAIHLNEISHGNWFTIERVIKKSAIKKPIEVKMILDMLIMSRKAFAKKDGDTIKYKVTLNKDCRIKVLENQIKWLDQSKELLQKELAELSK